MTFKELLEKMREANDAGHGDKEAGFRLSTWLMIMEHIESIEEQLGMTSNSIVETKTHLENQVAAVKEEVAKTEQQIIQDDASKIMF